MCTLTSFERKEIIEKAIKEEKFGKKIDGILLS
jgi:hypothetical protein